MNGAVVCRTCVTTGEVNPGEVNPGLTPWDRRDELGLLSALWQTVKGVSLAPTEFFEQMSPTGRLAPAMGFLVLATIPASIVSNTVSYVSNLALAPMLEPFIRNVYGPEGNTLSDLVVGSMQPSLVGSGFWILAYPFAIVVYALVTGLVCHLGLMLCGGATQPLEATIKTSVYAFAILFWAVIPIVGGLASIWLLVALVFGLSTVHRSGGFKATFSVLYAPCTCACLGVGGIVALVALGAMAIGGASGY
jgi:hypothetical protein